MINLWIVFAIIIIHYIADFWLQTDWQAQNKSNNITALLNHTLIYTCCWFPFVLYFHLTGFLIITFICHTITDYFTSRLNSKLIPKRQTMVINFPQVNKEASKANVHYFPKGENYHNFFLGIGGDQVLHYIQLFLTYWLLTK